MDKKKILLLGGAGYLGQWIFDGLLMSHKYKVDIIDKKYYGNDLFSSLYFVGSDVRTDLQKIDINQYDSIINVAAIVGDGASKINPKIAEDTELIPLQYLKDNYKGFLIWTSSCSVYGDSGGSDILTESSNTNPLSPYAEIKLKGEQILKDRPNTLILRLGTLYGYSLSNRQRFDLVVNKFAIDCMSKKEITVFNGGQYRPLLFVSDAAKAIVKAIDNSDLRTKFSIYNLCEGNYTIDEIADIFHKTFKY
ncbi:MAG: SDR family oxidoreductase, partial [Proteobacteria bacterium]